MRSTNDPERYLGGIDDPGANEPEAALVERLLEDALRPAGGRRISPS